MLVALGICWNFLYVGGTTLLTSTYAPSEAARAQAAHDIIDCGAELTAELISGDVANHHLKALTADHEAAIETAFQRDEDKTDLSRWLYNGPGTPDSATGDSPGIGRRLSSGRQHIVVGGLQSRARRPS